MCSGDGDVPLYLRVADGNEADRAMFACVCSKSLGVQCEIDALFVADAALYCEENIKQMDSWRWLSRVPATLAAAKSAVRKHERGSNCC